MSTDEQLMLSAAEGDMDAFEELVRRHQQGALNVAYRFLSDRTLAEDVAQEAFMKILAGADRYRPSARFRTYLYNVIWHLCIDVHRKRKPLRLDSLRPQPSDEDGPADAALRDERSARVQAAIRNLPPRQRMALVLKHYEGMSYKDIGKALRCSARAVDALLSRAKRQLKEELKDAI